MSTPPVVVKDAATVLLLRPAPTGQGVEVFMQVRASSMAFAAGAAVFPGGSVDTSDREGTEAWGDIAGADRLGLDPSDAAQRALSGAVVSAALRETFEECGVLLAEGGGTVTQGDRDDLAAHRIGLSALLRERNLSPSLAAVACVDRWITPEGEPRRYDTRFFAAILPEGQEADDATTESARSFWVRPAEALEQFAEGTLALMPPTWAQLERLARAGTLAEALTPAETEVTVPVLEHTEGTVVARFWGSEEYRKAGRPQHS